MSKKVMTIKRGIAVPFGIGQNGKITVADHHLVMNEHGEWEKEKRPGIPMMSLGIKTISESDKRAEEIVKNCHLSDRQKAYLVNRISQFIAVYVQLYAHIHTPVGNVDIAEDSVELRNLWHLYLLRGRELIDEVGKKIRTCFGLKQHVNGLSSAKFVSWENILRQEMRKRDDLSELVENLEKYREALIEFIELRNRDKKASDTLLEPPYISPSGIPRGGKVTNRETNREFDFVEYFHTSFKSIMQFAEAILG